MGNVENGRHAPSFKWNRFACACSQLCTSFMIKVKYKERKKEKNHYCTASHREHNSPLFNTTPNLIKKEKKKKSNHIQILLPPHPQNHLNTSPPKLKVSKVTASHPTSTTQYRPSVSPLSRDQGESAAPPGGPALPSLQSVASVFSTSIS